MSNSGDLEVIYCHPHPETRQGLYLLCPAEKVMEAPILTVVNTHLLPAAEPTRKPTRTLNHLCTATTDEWCRDRLQSKETDTSNDLCHSWPNGGIRYIQWTITYYYQIMQDQRFVSQHVNGCWTGIIHTCGTTRYWYHHQSHQSPYLRQTRRKPIPTQRSRSLTRTSPRPQP